MAPKKATVVADFWDALDAGVAGAGAHVANLTGPMVEHTTVANVAETHLQLGVGEVIDVRIGDVEPNPFGEDVTPEFVEQALGNIQSIEHWSSTFGQFRCHGSIMVDTVSRLVTEGVKQWGREIEAYDSYPNATAATFWIYLYAENNTDQKLYDNLALCAKYFHPYVWTAETCQTMAFRFLRSTANQMTKEGVQEMQRQFVAFDALRRGGEIDVPC